MSSIGTTGTFGRRALAAALGLVLLFQLMASALARSSHLAVKYGSGEIALNEICGTTPGSNGDRAAHVEGVNTCCVWAKSVALAPLTPPAPVSLTAEVPRSSPITFVEHADAMRRGTSNGPPNATGPPILG